MPRQVPVKFTFAELERLEAVMQHIVDEGVYWGRRDYFDTRNAIILGRLKNYLSLPGGPYAVKA